MGRETSKTVSRLIQKPFIYWRPDNKWLEWLAVMQRTTWINRMAGSDIVIGLGNKSMKRVQLEFLMEIISLEFI